MARNLEFGTSTYYKTIYSKHFDKNFTIQINIGIIKIKKIKQFHCFIITLSLK